MMLYFDYINQEAHGYKSHLNDTTDEKIFISDKEYEACAGKVDDEDV